MTFRPTFWPTVFTVPALAALIALGTWQLHRLQWKQDLLDKLHNRAVASAVAPPAAGDDLEAFEFRRVRVTGTYRLDDELYLVGRSLAGAPGLHILTPLVPADGSTAILVDRGYVPFEGRDAKEIMIKHVKQKLVPCNSRLTARSSPSSANLRRSGSICPA